MSGANGSIATTKELTPAPSSITAHGPGAPGGGPFPLREIPEDRMSSPARRKAPAAAFAKAAHAEVEAPRLREALHKTAERAPPFLEAEEPAAAADRRPHAACAPGTAARSGAAAGGRPAAVALVPERSGAAAEVQPQAGRRAFAALQAQINLAEAARLPLAPAARSEPQPQPRPPRACDGETPEPGCGRAEAVALPFAGQAQAAWATPLRRPHLFRAAALDAAREDRLARWSLRPAGRSVRRSTEDVPHCLDVRR